MNDRQHILIVGAGIIGASIAWHLARTSARVTVVEAGKPGGVATRNSRAWINASWGNPKGAVSLMRTSLQSTRCRDAQAAS